jgi:hypothetical protein
LERFLYSLRSRLLDGLAVPLNRLHLVPRGERRSKSKTNVFSPIPTALDNGQRSMRKQLAALVKRLLDSLTRQP